MADERSVPSEAPVAVRPHTRPDKLNALNSALLSAIVAALDAIELDAALRGVVITGAGRAFSAGPTLPSSTAICGPARRRRSHISCARGIG